MNQAPLVAALLLPLVLTACGTTKSDDTSTGDTTNDTATGDDTATTDTSSDVEDTSSLIDTDLSRFMQADAAGCEQVEDRATPGAASYFRGGYMRQPDGTWTGEEVWYLYANAAWRTLGGMNCVVRWTTVANQTTGGACATCAFGLDVSATLNVAGSTCPEALYAGDENFTTVYGIAPGDAGKAEVYFARSGTLMTETAVFNDGAMGFLTPRTCTWF